MQNLFQNIKAIEVITFSLGTLGSNFIMTCTSADVPMSQLLIYAFSALNILMLTNMKTHIYIFTHVKSRWFAVSKAQIINDKKYCLQFL